MSRTYRNLFGGRVPDGHLLRHKGLLRRPRTTNMCWDDTRKYSCSYCHSYEKRKQMPIEIMRSELELWDFELREQQDMHTQTPEPDVPTRRNRPRILHHPVYAR